MAISSELIKEYIKLAKFHAKTDSADPENTNNINKAADSMIEIAEIIDSQKGTNEFVSLLEHKDQGVGTWASFNLIERMSPDKKELTKALKEIEKLAKSDNLDAFGAKIWLKDWKRKHGM